MDFFAQQDRARRNTGRLLFYFSLAVVLTILLVYFLPVLGWHAYPDGECRYRDLHGFGHHRYDGYCLYGHLYFRQPRFGDVHGDALGDESDDSCDGGCGERDAQSDQLQV